MVRNSKYKIAKEKYKKTPYIEPSQLGQLEIISPDTGVIAAKVGDTIHFKIKYNNTLSRLQINTNTNANPEVWKTIKEELIWDEKALAKQKYVDFLKRDDIYTFNYVVTDKNMRYIDVLFELNIVMKFKVAIIK
ncbi:hypothetical protein Q765_01165 [Flavobacterium rivuli WB 3.3-2 = DSM 21788]|uniref:Uncharacterized protein n=1 Tax=Flavobacterium rivuli WB 3.3-2 = DSM 21788 TaxID=1121895 RepID=A0A0A2M7A9_9FLAO|nr:hypothetical protein [Flavobacterium rivuli]KGO88547.1 hypothetical protein Q765_01165 [Flavobacterium rivuli WB 3.3-2 = DSM 21788]